jgi:hypothetical protein
MNTRPRAMRVAPASWPAVVRASPPALALTTAKSEEPIVKPLPEDLGYLDFFRIWMRRIQQIVPGARSDNGRNTR